MARFRYFLLAAVAFLPLSCSEGGLPLNPAPAEPVPDVATDVVMAPPAYGVGTFGRIETIKPQEQGLVLYQTGLDFEAAAGTKVNNARHDLAVGARHQKLQVHIKDSTEIWIGGKQVTVDSLAEGMSVLVVGRVTGAALHADQIMDLSDAGPPPAGAQGVTGLPLRSMGAAAGAGIRTTSMCMGQRLPDHGAGVLEFQGCWGGPSAADHVDTGFIPVFCPIIGCFGIDRLTYTAALAGWGYAFPFRFEATPRQMLVYHVPGIVDLKVSPLDAGSAVSFWGGLGLDFGIGFRWCGIFGCYDLGVKHLSLFTTAHESAGAAPLTGQRLEIATTSCPSVGLIPIEGIPINPLELGICQGLALDGRAFEARVEAVGAQNPSLGVLSFGPASIAAAVRPMGMSVNIRYDTFRWVPELQQSLFFRFRSFAIKLFDTPAIPLGSGAWDAITTPFPTGVFTVATDPLSPVDALRYLYHPTQAQIALDVDPAATLLSLTSGNAVVEGTAVTAWLREEYMSAPIAGAPVAFEATGLNGTPSTAAVVTTDSRGIAGLLLPPGEYTIVARYAGGETYLPSTATQHPVYVYRPTTFVIWGGNPDGLQPGARYQFWGARWTTQVAGGDFTGNASFQGFALPLDDASWQSPPAASARIMPAELADVIGVIITTRVSGRGSWSIGNIAGHAVLRVDQPQAYRPAGGHDAWGTLRLQLP